MQDNRYNGSLETLLSIQETLDKLVAGSIDPPEGLSVFLSLLMEQLDAADGRLLLTDPQSDHCSLVTHSGGQGNMARIDDLAGCRLAEIEEFVAHEKEARAVAGPLDEMALLIGPLPDATGEPWSALILPVGTTDAVHGYLALLNPGLIGFAQEFMMLANLAVGQLNQAMGMIQIREHIQKADDRAQELAAKNQDLGAILVHDLQGPLGNVVASLELIQQELDADADSSQALMVDIALRSSRQVQVLVDSLLDISRLEAGQPVSNLQPVSISKLFDYVAEFEKPILEQHQVTLVREDARSLPLIRANAGILQRVLINLFDNALRVSRSGSSISVRGYAGKTESMVTIEVKDQGPGIPAADRERIFEKYQRVDRTSSSKGLGLGLAFCKLAVEAHGGLIWATDNPTEGACICFTIPVYVPDP